MKANFYEEKHAGIDINFYNKKCVICGEYGVDHAWSGRHPVHKKCADKLDEECLEEIRQEMIAEGEL